MKTSDSDLKIIGSAREEVRRSVVQFCKVYCDLAGEKAGETIGCVLDGQLRTAKKLADLEKLYKASVSKDKSTEELYEQFRKLIDKQ